MFFYIYPVLRICSRKFHLVHGWLMALYVFCILWWMLCPFVRCRICWYHCTSCAQCIKQKQGRQFTKILIQCNTLLPAWSSYLEKEKFLSKCIRKASSSIMRDLDSYRLKQNFCQEIIKKETKGWITYGNVAWGFWRYKGCCTKTFIIVFIIFSAIFCV